MLFVVSLLRRLRVSAIRFLFSFFSLFLLRSLIIWGPELSCLLLVSSFSLFSKKNLVFQFKSSVWGAGLVPVLYSIYVLSNPSQQRARSPAPITLQFNNILFFLYVLSTSPKNFQLFFMQDDTVFFLFIKRWERENSGGVDDVVGIASLTRITLKKFFAASLKPICGKF